jgi:hypothetical protein
MRTLGVSDYRLIVEYLIALFDVYQLSVRILVALGRLRYDGKTPMHGQELKELLGGDAERILEMATAPKEDIDRACFEYPDSDLFDRYDERRRRLELMKREYIRRLHCQPVGSLLTFMPYHPAPEELPPIIERTLTAKRIGPRRLNHKPTVGEAYELFTEYRDQAVSQLDKSLGEVPFQQYIKPLNATEAFWLRIFRDEWWSTFLRRDLESRLILLDGRMENIPRRLRDRKNDDLKTAKRRRKILHRNHNDVESAPPDEPEDLLLRRERIKRAEVLSSRAYTVAAKRWGERGRKFLVALSVEETSVEKASTAAGVTRQMDYKYLRELKKALTPKK